MRCVNLQGTKTGNSSDILWYSFTGLSNFCIIRCLCGFSSFNFIVGFSDSIGIANSF